MKRLSYPSWILLTALFLSLSLEGALEQLDERVETVREAFDLPGVAISVIRDNQVIVSEGYGVKDVRSHEPVTRETLFGLASGTKPFTAYLLQKLADQGRLDLDDPVVKHLPEFRLADKALSDKITIKHLLTHRSGLPRHDLMWYGGNYSRQELLARLQYLEPVAEPGEAYHYSNIMFTMAGMVAERVLGVSWEEAIQIEILNPLFMGGTRCSVPELIATPDWAKPHVWTKEGVIAINPRPCLTAPASSLNISVSDGSKWLQAMLNAPQAGNMPIAYAAGSPDAVNWFKPTGHGLGWKLGDYHGKTVAFHGGHVEGYISFTAFLPEEKIGIVILTNNSLAGFHPISVLCRDILNELLRLDLPDVLAEEKGRYEAEKKALPVYQATEANANFFNPLSGVYEHPAYGKLSIDVEGMSPTLILNDLPFGLIQSGEKEFFVTSRILAFPHFKWKGHVNDDGSLELEFEPAAKPLHFSIKTL